MHLKFLWNLLLVIWQILRYIDCSQLLETQDLGCWTRSRGWRCWRSWAWGTRRLPTSPWGTSLSTCLSCHSCQWPAAGSCQMLVWRSWEQLSSPQLKPSVFWTSATADRYQMLVWSIWTSKNMIWNTVMCLTLLFKVSCKRLVKRDISGSLINWKTPRLEISLCCPKCLSRPRKRRLQY